MAGLHRSDAAAGVSSRKDKRPEAALVRIGLYSPVWEPTWKLDVHEPDRVTVEAVEQLAEEPTNSVKLDTIRGEASLEVDLLACENAFGAAWWAIEELPMAMPDWKNERLPQASLLRDIFGNPFHPVTINVNWLTWKDGAVRKSSQSIYDERAFNRMPILADALADAGCDNKDILSHCRGNSPHVKGCWVVDLVLGKE